jgi:hypothetical protein
MKDIEILGDTQELDIKSDFFCFTSPDFSLSEQFEIIGG